MTQEQEEAMSYLQRVIFDDTNWCKKVRESWQTLKAAVLAQQTNNNARDEICPWCNGRGQRVGQFNEEICNVCGGTGKGKHSPVA